MKLVPVNENPQTHTKSVSKRYKFYSGLETTLQDNSPLFRRRADYTYFILKNSI